MDYAFRVYVSQRTGKLRNPEAYRLFGEGLSRDVEAQVTTVHEIDDYVPANGFRIARFVSTFYCDG